MKKIYLLLAATLGLLVFSAYSQKYSGVDEYRKAYSTLVEKWTTETNSIVRIELSHQIEQLKAENLSLFKK